MLLMHDGLPVINDTRIKKAQATTGLRLILFPIKYCLSKGTQLGFIEAALVLIA